MSYRKEFVFVEVHSGEIRQWKRVKLEDVSTKLMKASNNYRCFQTVQRYRNPNSETGEPVWMGVFFDLDNKEDPSKCIPDVKRLHNYLTEILGIDQHYIRVFFSGSKGFHILIEPEVFDIKPDKDVHFQIRRAAMHLAELLKIETFDVSVYSRRRILRMPNSIHEKTKLFKVELELFEVSKGMDYIRKIATKPRKALKEDEPEDVPICEDAKTFWDEMGKEQENVKELVNLKSDHKVSPTPNMPVCMDHLLSLTLLPRANTGNRTMLAMGSYLKDVGKTYEEAIAIMIPWALGLENIGWAKEPEKLEAAVRATIKHMYQEIPGEDNHYSFACKFMLSLSTNEHKIPCQRYECPAIKGKMQETKDTIDLDLAGFSNSTYLGEKVRVPTLISGKAGTPYVVPKRIRFVCTPKDDGDFCQKCPVSEFDGEASFTFSPRDQDILSVINTTTPKMWEAIRRRFRFPQGCRNSRGTVEENMNIEEVRMSPAAVDITHLEKQEHVNRRGFFIGYPIMSNTRFNLTGYPVRDPKTQQSVFLFEEKEKLSTEVETFEMSKEIHDELKVFQAEGGRVIEKFHEIHEDLAHNVTRIWDREQAAWAVDLVAHSVRGFRFRSEPFVKGWVELLIVGDSGQGKTSIVRRLVQSHYRIGEYISGGSARRTGLLYSYQESGKTWMLIWGALPLNDLGLVVIDEFGDLPEEEFAKMTDVRSSGIVKATGIVTAETFARVRLIALTNCKSGKHLAEYGNPVSALLEIVPAAEDIRRFDFACAVSSGEVAVEVINRAEFDKVPQVYTSRLCALLIRWVWSRKETEVEFTDGASRQILKEATRMAKDFYAGAIPLVEPADQRFKIARLAAAVAARVFSTNADGSKLVINEEHVFFTVKLLYDIYGSPNFKYKDWSDQQRRTDVAGAGTLEEVLGRIKMMDKWEKVIGILMIPGQTDQREVEAILDVDKAKAASTLSVLRIMGLLEKKYSKFHKTAKCNQLMTWGIESKKFTKEQIDKALIDEGPPPGFLPSGYGKTD